MVSFVGKYDSRVYNGLGNGLGYNERTTIGIHHHHNNSVLFLLFFYSPFYRVKMVITTVVGPMVLLTVILRHRTETEQLPVTLRSSVMILRI